MMRVLVVGSCGKRKRFSSPASPTCDTLIDKFQKEKWISKLSELTCKAREMYTGNQFRELIHGIDLLRKIPRVKVTLFIISAGFGVLREDEIIPPYDCSFNGMKKAEICQRSVNLGIRQDFEKIYRKRYDLSYIALGLNYLTALGPDWQENVNGKIIAFGKKNKGDNLLKLPCDAKIVKSLSSSGHKIHGVAGYKGDLLRIFATYAVRQADPYSEVASWTSLDNVRTIIDLLTEQF